MNEQTAKREHEKKIVSEMIDLYARKNDDIPAEELKQYAAMRIEKCPFMETKTFCSQCKVHCYRPEQREQIRKVMRYSGPRMLFHHPLMTIRHGYYSLKEKKTPVTKILWLSLGFIGLGLGVLGAALPLLPAFPFLLMAAFGFSKGSDRIHTWFISSRLYKDNLESWVKHRGMDRKTKIRVMSVITLTMAVGFYMMDAVPVGRIVLLIVWIFHIIYFIFGIRTLEAA